MRPMILFPIASATILSCAVHISIFTLFVFTNRLPELTKEITLSSSLQATLIQEIQDAGETIEPIVVPVETVETMLTDKTNELDKHVDELITSGNQERDQAKIATNALQTPPARATRDNQSLANDRNELQTKYRLVTKQLTELADRTNAFDQVISDQQAHIEKPSLTSRAASTLPTQLVPKSMAEMGNSAINHNPKPVAGNPKPHYPLLARNQGIEGRVVVNVLISAEGTVKDIDVGQSSGSRLLDKAAVQAVKNWRFHPVLHNGQAIPSTETVPIVFKLKDS